MADAAASAVAVAGRKQKQPEGAAAAAAGDGEGGGGGHEEGGAAAPKGTLKGLMLAEFNAMAVLSSLLVRVRVVVPAAPSGAAAAGGTGNDIGGGGAEPVGRAAKKQRVEGKEQPQVAGITRTVTHAAATTAGDAAPLQPHALLGLAALLAAGKVSPALREAGLPHQPYCSMQVCSTTQQTRPALLVTFCMRAPPGNAFGLRHVTRSWLPRGGRRLPSGTLVLRTCPTCLPCRNRYPSLRPL